MSLLQMYHTLILGCRAKYHLKCAENRGFSAGDSTETTETDPFSEGSFEDVKETKGELSVERAVSDWFSDVIEQTAVESAAMRKMLQDMNPPLNLIYTTPKHSTRFVLRVGPMFQAKEDLIDLFMWKNPSYTLIAFLLYSICCFSSACLLFLVFGSGFYILFAIHIHSRKEAATNRRFRFKLSDSTIKTNLGYLQNFMLQYSDAYDLLEQKLNDLHNMDNETFLCVLKYYTILVVAITVVFYSIPFNILCFLVGIALFFGNTPVLKSIVHVSSKHQWTLAEVITQKLNQVLQHVKSFSIHDTIFHRPLNVPLSSDDLRRGLASVVDGNSLVIYENQRWWPLVGYLPLTFTLERPPWSANETGTIHYPTYSAMSIDADRRLAWDGEWKIHEWKYSGMFWTKDVLFGKRITRSRKLERTIFGVIKKECAKND